MSQVYQFVERYEYVTTIEFFNSNALQNVQQILFLSEEGLVGTFLKKEFRYSFDNVTWSNWITLTLTNLTNLNLNDEPELYLHFRYTREGIAAANISTLYLTYEGDETYPPAPEIDVSIDADYFRGQDPSYYLYRPNQYGPFTDLQVANISGTGEGAFHSRTDTSLGSSLLFRKFIDSSTVSVLRNGGFIQFNSSGNATGIYDSNLDPISVMPYAVGGHPAGTTVADLLNDPLVEMWDALLFPTVNPVFSNPYVTFVLDVSGLQEIGANVSINFTATFDRGIIDPNTDVSSFQNYRSGLSNTFNYSGTGLPVFVTTTNLVDQQSIVNIVTEGNQNWVTSVNYDQGPQPYDNKGNPYSTPLPAGLSNIATVTIEGVYPLYGTTVDISTLTKHTLYSMISGNNIEFTLVSESGIYKQKVDIPLDWPNPLLGIETFNSVTNQWEYQTGSPASSLTFWTTSATTHTIQGNVVNYTRYTYNGVNRSSVKIRLKF